MSRAAIAVSTPASSQARSLSAERVVRVANAGVLTWGAEDLVIEEGALPEPGRAVCIASGHRLAFRRVLDVKGRTLRLRGDVAPFEDEWTGDVVGCVRPRLIDRIATIDPVRFTQANWQVAVASAHARAAKKRFAKKPHKSFVTRELDASEWPNVRAFWKRACGEELPVEAHAQQHLIGLFDGCEMVGANVHLVFGATSYSAYTLVDRRYRGCGGGRQMIRHAVMLARALHLESIYVHIKSRNLPSIGAYQREGFVKRDWWSDASDPLAAAERQWLVYELDLGR